MFSLVFILVLIELKKLPLPPPPLLFKISLFVALKLLFELFLFFLISERSFVIFSNAMESYLLTSMAKGGRRTLSQLTASLCCDSEMLFSLGHVSGILRCYVGGY